MGEMGTTELCYQGQPWIISGSKTVFRTISNHVLRSVVSFSVVWSTVDLPVC